MSAAPATVGDALRLAKALGIDRLDAQLLLAHVLRRGRTWLLAHEDAALDAAQADAARAVFKRRACGEPLAQLTGEKEFHGLTLKIDADVLVPRPETEVLVDWALELLSGVSLASACPSVADLGTGSGAIALAIKQSHPAAKLWASDLSPAALRVAQANAERLGIDVCWREGNWWDAFDGARFHLALSNPPYIADDDPHLGALGNEPTLALTPGGDGLGALRLVIAGAPAHLESGGWLLLEHGYDQAEAVTALLRRNDFQAIETRRDLAGQPRCTAAHR